MAYQITYVYDEGRRRLTSMASSGSFPAAIQRVRHMLTKDDDHYIDLAIIKGGRVEEYAVWHIILAGDDIAFEDGTPCP